MPLITKKQPDFQNVVAGNVATCNVVSRGTIYGLQFVFRTAAGALITAKKIKDYVEQLTLSLNGTPIIDVDASFLYDDKLIKEGVIGYEEEDGVLSLNFMDPLLDLAESRVLSVLGTANLKDIAVEMKLAGAIGTLAKIECFVLGSVENRVLGRHTRKTKMFQNFDGTGVLEVTNLPFNTADTAYKSIAIGLGDGGVIKNISLKINENIIIDKVSPAMMNELMRQAKLTPIDTKYFYIPMNLLNTLNEFLRTNNITSMQLDIDWGTTPGGSFPIYLEREFAISQR